MSGGVCAACGEPATTEVVVPIGQRLTKLGCLCSACRRMLLEDAARYAAGDASLFKPIDTGQRFPPNARTYAGKCKQCWREGEITRCVVDVAQVARTRPIPACAECLADMVRGANLFKGAAAVFVETPSGEMRRAAELRRD